MAFFEESMQSVADSSDILFKLDWLKTIKLDILTYPVLLYYINKIDNEEV